MLKFDPPIWPHPTPEEEEHFKRYLSINSINKDVIIKPALHCGPNLHPGIMNWRNWIYPTWGCFHTISVNLVDWFLRGWSIKIFRYTFLWKNSNPNCGLTLPSGTMICTNFNVHVLWMLSYNFHLLGPLVLEKNTDDVHWFKSEHIRMHLRNNGDVAYAIWIRSWDKWSKVVFLIKKKHNVYVIAV